MARKKKPEEHENLERWLVSYADFITLLFAFFTVLYALSMTDKAKYKQAVENVQRAFQSAGGIFPLRGSPFTPFNRPMDRGSKLPPGAADSGGFSKTGDEGADRVAEQIRGLFERTTGFDLRKGEVGVERTEGGYKIRLGEAMLFHPGSAKLRKEHVPFLLEMGKKLQRVGAPIQIEGHTDKAPRETQEASWSLSVSRPYHVLRFLVDAVDFSAEKVAIAGYGDTQPISDNETDEGRRRNRRVEISVFAPDRRIENLDW